MKKNIISILTISCIIVSATVMFAGCTKLSAEEEAVVGKYNLIELSCPEIPMLNASLYDYFYIDFKSNKKCTVASKISTVVYEADASWKVNKNGEIEVISKSGFAKATEIYTLSGDILSGTNEGIIEGVKATITMKFKKVTETPETEE